VAGILECLGMRARWRANALAGFAPMVCVAQSNVMGPA
jgi:hypothetical protein